MIYILNVFAVDSFNFISALAVIAAKATFLVGFAALLCLTFRRFSAAMRHFVWTLAICASLLLPFLSFVKGWEISVPITSLSNLTVNELNKEIVETPKTQRQPENLLIQTNDLGFRKDTKFFSDPLLIPNPTELQLQSEQKGVTSFLPQLFNLILIVWIIGVCLFSFRLLTGIISTGLLSRQTSEFENPALNELFSTLLTELKLKDNIRLLKSEKTLMPIVCKIWQPVVILPAIAETWSEERCRMVLLHELTHIARRDCLTQMLAQVACVFYWFNPLMWFAAHRLRAEREQACDAYVVSIGARPSDYAEHLLEIARSAQNEENKLFAYSPTIAMAQRSQLEERLLAILSPKNKDRRISQLATVSLMVITSIFFLSLAVIHPIATNANSQQITDFEINAQAESKTEEKSFLELLLAVGSKSQIDVSNQVNEKVEISLNSEEVLETMVENKIKNDYSINKNASDEEQNINQNLNQTEQIPISNPSPSSNANPFVNAEYTEEKQNESQLQTNSDDFIDEMASVGYRNLSLDELIHLKSVGVTAEYVKGLRAAGVSNLTVKELIHLRAVGLTPKYIEGIRNAGFKEATIKEISNLKALNVTPEFISKFRDAGFSDLSVKDLMNLKASNISLEFINTINSMGFGKLSLRELTNLKFIGVTPEFIKLARSRLGDDLTIKQIVSLKHSGILKDKEKEKE